MMRGYTPRLSTVHLMGDIGALPGVASVRTLPPTRSRPYTMLRVTLTALSGDGQPIRTDFTIADARAWLAHERNAR